MKLINIIPAFRSAIPWARTYTRTHLMSKHMYARKILLLE